MITINYITRAYYGITRVWLDRYTHIPNSYTRNGISCGNTVISIYSAFVASFVIHLIYFQLQMYFQKIFVV